MLGDFKIFGASKMLSNLRFGGPYRSLDPRNLRVSKYWDLLR